MNAGGWILLTLSWGLILGLAVFCFARVFARRPPKRAGADSDPTAGSTPR